MNTRWQYGNYTFRINPSGHDSSVSVIGDDCRTLNGTVISQPTGLTETHDVTATFYQQRTRVINEKSIPNGYRIDFNFGACFVLNKQLDVIQQYSPNLATVIATVPLSGCPNKNYNGFDIDASGNYWVSSDASGNTTVYNVNSSGGIISTGTIVTPTPVTGIELLNSSLYALQEDGLVHQVNPNTYALIANYQLPTNLMAYNGIESDGTYLIVGGNDNNQAVMYHFDINAGHIVNMMMRDSINSIDDISFDGNYFYVLNHTKGTMQTIQGDTCQLDVYGLEQQISHGYVTMSDQMGIQKQVAVQNYQKTRALAYENRYDISMTIQTVSRGVY